MPRKPRDRAAGTFHIYTHCVYATARLYHDAYDRRSFLTHLARTTVKLAWKCHAFCEMGSHYHLIVSVTDDLLPRAMHSLNLGYAKDFNRRHGLKGHVQYAPYGARRISGAASLATRYRYVVRNPVRAGICRAPEDWPWSSYAGTAGLGPGFSFIDDTLILQLYEDLAELRDAVRDS